jgi:hypothetical protein
MASLLTFNGAQHEENEANLVSVSKRAIYSPRQRKLQQVKEWEIVGEVQKSTVADIIARVQVIEQMYSQDGSSATYSIDGTIAHQLGGDSVSGVQVVYAAFPKGDPAELATKRTFAVKLRATYDATGEQGGDDLVSWQESITIEGDGGPLLVGVHEMAGVQTAGGPIVYQLCPRTIQGYIQTGSAVGYATYPAPPGPVNPAGVFGNQTRITYTSGRQVGNGIRFFTTKWYYRQFLDIAVFGATDYRPTSK